MDMKRDFLRLAIAAEAWNIGMPIEKAVELFRPQDDFDPEISRAKVEGNICTTLFPV
jgi:DNA primase large subunit